MSDIYRSQHPRAIYSREWRLKNPDKVKSYRQKDGYKQSAKKYQQSEKGRVADRKWYNRTIERRKELAKEQHFRRKYGLTIEQRDAMIVAQNFSCAACFTQDSGVQGWNVDHDHKTGKVRAILCPSCNVALGRVKDSKERLQQLIQYLDKFEDFL